MSASTSQANAVTIRGSTAICTEFFGYAVNSILFQRGVYPPDSFKPVQKYGLRMMVTCDAGLQEYLGSVLSQLSEWLLDSQVHKLVLVITAADSGDVLERWSFDIQSDAPPADGAPVQEKPEREIMKEIQSVIRQITASVTFLPLIDEPVTFDLLVYTTQDVAVPGTWEESDPRYISGNKDSVKLRSFSTKVHKVEGMVAYKTT